MNPSSASSPPTEEPLVVLDIGARWGVFESWSQFVPDVQVTGFEPDAAECARLNAKAPDWVRYYPIALGRSESEGTLVVTVEPACSSLYEPRIDLISHVPQLGIMTPVERQPVGLVALDNFMDQSRHTPAQVLKLDTQGSELDVLKGAEHTLESVELIEVEVEFNEMYQGQPLFADVDSFLRRRGFELWRLGPIVHYASPAMADVPTARMETFFTDRLASATDGAGQLFWAQAYYLKSGLGITADSLDPVRARRIAMGAAGLGLHDLASHVVKLGQAFTGNNPH